VTNSSLTAHDGVQPTIGTHYQHLHWLSRLDLGGPELARFFSSHERRLVLTRFTNNGIVSPADLIDLTLDDVADWRGIGQGKLRQIVELLDEVEENVCAVLAELAFDSAGDGGDVEESVIDSHMTEEPLGTLAAWGAFANGATTLGELDAVLRSEPMPADVELAVRALAAVPLHAPTTGDPMRILMGWVESLGERDSDILRSRVVQFEPATLDDIGKRHGVTRERIRQVESQLAAGLRAKVSEQEWTSVRWAVHRLREGLGAYAPDGELPLVNDQGARSYEFGILLWLAGFVWRKDDGSLLRDGFALPHPATLPLIDGSPVVDEPRLRSQLLEAGVTERHVDLAIVALRGLRRVDGHLVLWPKSIVSQAMAVLWVRGVPMTPEELAEVMGGSFNLRGFRDRLFNDEQICRVTKSTVGLREWGGGEYTTIVDLMCQRLDATGTRSLAELASELSAEFEVSNNSILAYSAAPIFVVQGGTMRLRRTDEPYVPRHEPEKVRGLYLSGEDVALWHLPVDNDVTRGSGRALPSEIATHMGLTPGTRVKLVTSQGPLPVSWTETSHTGPNIGSMRSLAVECNAQVGDCLRLTFDRRNHSLTASVRHPHSTDHSLLDQLSALTGLRASACSSRADLAAAVQCRPEMVVDVLRSRGDEDVAGLATLLLAT